MSSDLAVRDGSFAGAIERLSGWALTIAQADADELAEVCAYSEAVGIAARAKSSDELAKQAAEVRMRALKRLAEVLETASPDEREHIWHLFPKNLNGKSSLRELSAIPEERFEKALSHQLVKGDCWSIPALVRRARVQSLTHVEPHVKQAWDGTYWAHDRYSWRLCESLDDARRRAGLRLDPGTKRIEELYSQARLLSQAVSYHRSSTASESFTQKRHKLLQEAELQQMKVAELLHEAYLERSRNNDD